MNHCNYITGLINVIVLYERFPPSTSALSFSLPCGPHQLYQGNVVLILLLGNHQFHIHHHRRQRENMGEVNPLKETLSLGALNVVLPTIDVYSDVLLAEQLYVYEYYIYATSLAIPFFINYALGWRAWYYGDNQQRQKFTWIFPLLGCYPQLAFVRSICLFWTKPKKAMRKKKHLERNVIENEVFTEAVPTTFIMTFLVVVMNGDVLLGDEGAKGVGMYFFFTTFATSALSAGLGLAKCLKVSFSLAQLLALH